MIIEKDIIIGLRFRLKETGRTYEVTDVGDKSVWFKDLSRNIEFRELKHLFPRYFLPNSSFYLVKK